jgi:preprotein translocase subunit SecE
VKTVAEAAESGRRDDRDRGEPGFFARLLGAPKRWSKFLHEVRVEMKKVTWPSRHDVFTTTSVVIATVAFFGIFFFFVDEGASYLMQHALNFFKH